MVSMKREKAKRKAVVAIRTIVQAAKELAEAEYELEKELHSEQAQTFQKVEVAKKITEAEAVAV